MTACRDFGSDSVRRGRCRVRLPAAPAAALAALVLALGLVLGGAPTASPARAEGYISFGFGTSFGDGYRYGTGFGWVSRPYYWRPYYGRPYWRKGYYRRGYEPWYTRHRYSRPGYCRADFCAPYPWRKSTVVRKEVVVPARKPRVVAPVATRPQAGCRMIREYQTTITVSGREVAAYGDACLQADGSWRLGPPKPVPDG